jgi:hypothetical protein
VANLNMKRAERGLDQVINTIETLVTERPPSNPETLERMIYDLHDIRRSMKKLDNVRVNPKKRFWRLSRRAVRLSTKIMNLLSKA